MIKVGFELELFCTIDGKPVLVPNGLPYDECGWLVEVRSEPHTDVWKAIGLFEAEINSVYRAAQKAGVTLVRQPLMEIPRELKVAAARKHGKGLLRYENIYGHETHRCSSKMATAALHISLTNTQVFNYRKSAKVDASVYHGWILGKLSLPAFCQPQLVDKEFKYQGFIDHAKLIGRMDVAFKGEIRAAKRNPGFYEVKADGRIEYRSLPNDVDLQKVGKVLEDVLK